MERITRNLKHSGRDIIYKFSTWSIIFEPRNKEKMPSLAYSLFEYLERAFKEGVPSAEESPSQAKELMLNVTQVNTTDYPTFAKNANYHGTTYRQHDVVQDFFMNEHPNCLAVEAPVRHEERGGYMDFIMYYPVLGEVHILDFKPKAHAERKAATQLYHYKTLLHKVAKIPLRKIRCFYFDDKHCYEVTI
jgi:hypothetical protein